MSWEGEEFKCKVVEVKAGAVKVHYVGWGAGHDEWVPTEGEDKPPLPKENEAGVENVTKEAKKPCFCKFAFISKLFTPAFQYFNMDVSVISVKLRNSAAEKA